MLTAPKVERWAETVQTQGIRKEATQCASTRTHIHSAHALKLKMRMQCIQDIVGRKKLWKKKKNRMREGKKPHTNKTNETIKERKKEEKERKKKKETHEPKENKKQKISLLEKGKKKKKILTSE